MSSETKTDKDYEVDQPAHKVDKLIDALVDIEEKVREIYRNNGEDEQVSKLCNEIFEIVRVV